MVDRIDEIKKMVADKYGKLCAGQAITVGNNGCKVTLNDTKYMLDDQCMLPIIDDSKYCAVHTNVESQLEAFDTLIQNVSKEDLAKCLFQKTIEEMPKIGNGVLKNCGKMLNTIINGTDEEKKKISEKIENIGDDISNFLIDDDLDSLK